MFTTPPERPERGGGACETRTVCAAEPVILVDAADPRADGYRALRARESGEILWAEGPTVVERLLASSLTTRSVLVTPALYERLRPAIEQHATVRAGAVLEVLLAERSVIQEVVGFDLHRGAMAIADRPPLREVGDVLAAARRVAVLEGLNDPENLGAIARSARGLGADALLLDPTCADPYYRRSVRVSMGELLHLPVARSADWDATLAALPDHGFDVWALTPAATAAPLASLDVPTRVVLLVGAEGPGLRPSTLARCRNVRIPMHHGVDSLNVGHAVAAALAVLGGRNPRTEADVEGV